MTRYLKLNIDYKIELLQIDIEAVELKIDKLEEWIKENEYISIELDEQIELKNEEIASLDGEWYLLDVEQDSLINTKNKLGTIASIFQNHNDFEIKLRDFTYRLKQDQKSLPEKEIYRLARQYENDWLEYISQ